MKSLLTLALVFAAVLFLAAPSRAQTVVFAPAAQVTTFGTFGATVVSPVPGFALVQPTNGVFFSPNVVVAGRGAFIGGGANTVIVNRRGFRNRVIVQNGRNRVIVR